MSAVKDKTDEELLEALDFETACSLRVEAYLFGRLVRQSAPCPNVARWTLRCRACNSPGVACDEHTRSILRMPVSTFKPLGGGS